MNSHVLSLFLYSVFKIIVDYESLILGVLSRCGCYVKIPLKKGLFLVEKINELLQFALPRK